MCVTFNMDTLGNILRTNVLYHLVHVYHHSHNSANARHVHNKKNENDMV